MATVLHRTDVIGPETSNPQAKDDTRAMVSWTQKTPTVNSLALGPPATRRIGRAAHVMAGFSYVVVDMALAGGVIVVMQAVFGDASISWNLGRILLLAGAVLLGLKTALGLYPGFGLHPDARVRKSVVAWAGAGAITAVAVLFLDSMNWSSVIILSASFAAIGLLQILSRPILRFIFKPLGGFALRVHIAGTPDAVSAVRNYLRAHPDIGFDPVDSNLSVDTVLWADHDLPSSSTLDALRQCRQNVIVVSDLPRCRLSGVHPADHGGNLGLNLAFARQRSATDAIKRIFDLVLAVPLAVIALPIVAIAAAFVRLVDPGPAFFVQIREGRDGSRIGVLKLRTMYLEADKMLKDLLARDPIARAEWEAHFKLRKDPRILPYIGAFLRASSLDELPQLWNILRGDMSLVGPRPFPDYHLAAMPSDFRSRRASVIPGLTGLWQISERSSADLEGQQQLDDYYITGRSFWGDVSILLRTFSAVLARRGAY